jgi:hypothetical protein
MNEELLQNSVFQTVISGTLVFCLSQIIQKFILEPILEYKKTIGKIDNKLKYYSNKISTILSKTVLIETSEKVRELSCDLESSYKQIPFNKFFVWIKIIPGKKAISDSSKSLIRVSNIVTDEKLNDEIKIFDEIEKIRNLLNIPEL